MNMPRLDQFESTLALLREGYEFVGNGCRQLNSPAFECRLLLQRTYCLQGREAATLFYQSPHLCRTNAAPRALVRTLFGKGAIQGLDGPRHRARKHAFLGLLTGAEGERLVSEIDRHLSQAMRRWAQAGTVDVLPAMQTVLYEAVCHWAGLPEQEINATRQHQIVMLIAGAGSKGARHLLAGVARRQAEHWAARLIARQRENGSVAPAGSPFDVIARFSEPGAKQLPARIAAVELLNLLRPVVAVSYFNLYSLVELARHPQWQAPVADDPKALRGFVQEVRRLYAFFPVVAARVTRDFMWHGMHFRKGARVMLDLYGSNRNTDAWNQPEMFEPQRFNGVHLDPFTLISQGGGDAHAGHRCAGEWLTVAVMETVLHAFATRITYDAPVLREAPRRDRFPMAFSRPFVLSRVMLLGPQHSAHDVAV